MKDFLLYKAWEFGFDPGGNVETLESFNLGIRDHFRKATVWLQCGDGLRVSKTVSGRSVRRQYLPEE